MRGALCFLLYFQLGFASLSERIESLVQHVAPNSNVGIEIISLNDGKTLYQKNSSHLFTPSSTVKVFTAAAALSLLGPDFCFETSLLTEGKIRKGILQGNIYLLGSGDPEFSSEDLEAFALKLKKKNISHIRGNLILDNTAFDAYTKGPGWMWDDTGDAWDAPVDALLVDQGCIKILVKSGDKIGKPLHIALLPKTSHIKIENLSLTEESEHTLNVKRRWMTHENVVEIRGKTPLKTEQEYVISVESPSLYAGQLLLDFFDKHHITFNGQIKLGKVPGTVKYLATHRSSPLLVLLKKMVKESDNLYADSLFKKMGAERFGYPGTWKKGKEAVLDYLSSLGIEKKKLALVDGSGLSRYNQISPHQFTLLLRALFKDSKHFSDFVSCFAVGGIDGTLKRRMEDPLVKGKVIAKAGTMTGVTALVGYIDTKEKRKIGFSIMTNGFVEPCKFYKLNLEDEICKIMTEEI